MPPRLVRVFIDEAGNVSSSQNNHILVIAALCTQNTKTIDRLIRTVQKKHGSSLASGELKAKKEKTALKENVLSSLARAPIEVYAVVLNRHMIEHPPNDPEDLYRWSMARLVKKLAARYPRIEVILDRRYTNQSLRDQLTAAIYAEIANLPQQGVSVLHEDSIQRKELQAVDFIAWALFQKYERGNPFFYDLVTPILVEEELINKQTWEESLRNGYNKKKPRMGAEE